MYNFCILTSPIKQVMTIFVILNCHLSETLLEPVQQLDMFVELEVPTNGPYFFLHNHVGAFIFFEIDSKSLNFYRNDMNTKSSPHKLLVAQIQFLLQPKSTLTNKLPKPMKGLL